jgi:hypothetical protein
MATCKRCFKDTLVTIMSMFNTDVLCMDCKAVEEKRPDMRKRLRPTALRFGVVISTSRESG